MEILKVENLTFKYPKCEDNAIEDISFAVDKGEFVSLLGVTGSGKSTLLRLLKKELAPLGDKSGKVYFAGKSQDDTSPCQVGYVMQNPDQQIVTDKVWHELAFGLENMNTPTDVIARRVAEMASYFGIEDWYDRKVSELSGGQKQLLNLASIMVMQPDIIILDEPTAQLDPISASDFIATLKKLNQDLSLTIIIAEHRQEEIIPICDKLMVLDKGKLLSFGQREKVVEDMGGYPNLLCALPSAARLYHLLDVEGACPLNVKEGREFIENNFKNDIKNISKEEYIHRDNLALEFKNVYFRYEKDTKDILKGFNLSVYENEIFCLLGGNGSGKTTALSLASGLLKAYSGSIKVMDKKIKDYKNQSLYRNCLTMLPQDVQTVFLRNTVREELEDAKAEADMLPFDISYLYDKHPYDLSGGEQQLVALAKVLSTHPKILLLDEPTKGIDAHTKLGLISILKELKKNGMTIVIVTHDIEFAAICADRCAMFFNGEIVSEGIPDTFFSENTFYTTAANRMTKGYYSGAVTVEDVASLCNMNGKKDGAI